MFVFGRKKKGAEERPDEKKVETQVGDEKPADKKPEKKVVVDKPAAKEPEKKVVDDKPAGKVPEKKVVDDKPAGKEPEKKVVDDKPAGKEPEKKVVVDKPAGKDETPPKDDEAEGDDDDEDVISSVFGDDEEDEEDVVTEEDREEAALEDGGKIEEMEESEDRAEAEGHTLYSVQRIVKESTPLLLICIVLEVMGGQMLNSQEQVLVAIPLILMAIPVINGVGGNIGTVLGMRFTTALHLGEITPTLEGKTFKSNLIQALAMGVVSFGVLALLTSLAPALLGFDPGIDLWKYGLIMFGAGMLLTVLVVVVTITAAVYAYKKGYDPDNMVTPIVTTTCDLMGIISLLALLALVGVT